MCDTIHPTDRLNVNNLYTLSAVASCEITMQVKCSKKMFCNSFIYLEMCHSVNSWNGRNSANLLFAVIRIYEIFALIFGKPQMPIIKFSCLITLFCKGHCHRILINFN